MKQEDGKQMESEKFERQRKRRMDDSNDAQDTKKARLVANGPSASLCKISLKADDLHLQAFAIGPALFDSRVLLGVLIVRQAAQLQILSQWMS